MLRRSYFRRPARLGRRLQAGAETIRAGPLGRVSPMIPRSRPFVALARSRNRGPHPVSRRFVVRADERARRRVPGTDDHQSDGKGRGWLANQARDGSLAFHLGSTVRATSHPRKGFFPLTQNGPGELARPASVPYAIALH